MSCIDRFVGLITTSGRALGFACIVLCGMAMAAVVSGREPPAIEVQAIHPAVLQVGKANHVRVAKGIFLDEVTQLLFSHPGIQATLILDPPLPGDENPIPRYGEFTIAVDAQVPSGVYEARVVGRMGVSHPIAMLITRTEMMGGTENPVSLAAVAELSLGQGNAAIFQPSRRVEYRIPAVANQSIDIWCWAHALDIPSVPYAVLRDPSGREVARSRASGISPLRLRHQAQQTGDYRLTVQEFLFRGGEEYQYVLLRPTSEESMALEQGPSLQRPSRAGSAEWATLPELSYPEAQTPGEPELASIEALPVRMAGQFERDEDLDTFEFPAKAGESLVVEVLSRGRGEMTDPRLVLERVEKVEGKTDKVERIAVIDDQPAVGGASLGWVVSDPMHLWQVDRDCRLRVTLQDLLRNLDGKPRRYWLRCAVAQPGWEAFAYIVCPNNNPALAHPTGICLARGDVMAVRVVVARREGFQGSILVQALDLPTGVRCDAATIHPTQSETELHWVVAEDAGEWTGPIRIQTSCPEQPGLQTRESRSVTVHLGASTERGLPAMRFTSNLYAAIRPDIAPLTIAMGNGEVLEVAKGAKLEIPIRVTRREGGTDKCVLRPQNLPPKASLPEVVIEAKAPPANATVPNASGAPGVNDGLNVSEGKAELLIGADTPSGEYTIWMVAETKVKIAINPQSVMKQEEALKRLEGLKSNPPPGIELPKIEAAIQTVVARLEQARKDVVPREFPLFEPSTPVRIRVP